MDGPSRDRTAPPGDPSDRNRRLLQEALDCLAGETGPGAPPVLEFAADAGAGERAGADFDLPEMAASRRDATPESHLERTEPPPPAPVSVAAIAAAVRGGVSATREVRSCLARVASLDPELRAFVWTGASEALAAADRIDSEAGRERLPLAGVPIAHKDILFTAGIPTRAGSLLLQHHVPERDAVVVTRLARAGAVSLGKLNTHEFASGITGTVSAHGATVNPRAPERIPGGSSCGSAAAVAAGLVAAATATDTGGSIRIPAACCGTVGFKPTYGRVPTDGVIPFAWSLDHVGPIASSVADAALLFTVMAGCDPVPAVDAGGLRIGIAESWLLESAPEVAAAAREVGAALARLGSHVRAVEPPPLDDVAAVATAIFLAEAGALHARTLERFPDLYQGPTRAFLRNAATVPAPAYVQAQRRRREMCREYGRLFRQIDLLLCPTLPVPAPHIGATSVRLPAGEVDVRTAMTRYTRPFNLTGLPTLALPRFDPDSGLPLGVQLVGSAGADERVLGIGTLLERSMSS